jgi:hypothetical protein
MFQGVKIIGLSLLLELGQGNNNNQNNQKTKLFKKQAMTRVIFTQQSQCTVHEQHDKSSTYTGLLVFFT